MLAVVTFLKSFGAAVHGQRLRSLGLITFIFFVFGFSSVASAQQGVGKITGSIKDSTGAVVPGAAVEILNIATGVKLETATNSDGIYETPALQLGNYRVSAVVNGFKTAVADNVLVQVDRRAEVDLQLQVGRQAETIEVTSAPPALDTTSATIGTVMEEKPVHDLPLNGRNAVALVTLTPGVRDNLGAIAQGGFADRGQNISALTVNGSPTGTNAFILDGQTNVAAVYTDEIAINPTVDSIQEFKVQSGVMSAAYGFTAGGVVDLVTKSGTDQFHGTVYEFLRNDALDAANAFTVLGTRKPELRYNQYGAAVGGPIIHQKAFFFGNWEQSNYDGGLVQFLSVPTVQERGGDFSDLATASGTPIAIHNPYTGAAFPSNMINIPLDPVSVNIQNTFYPLPNTTPSNPYTHANNFVFEPKTVITRINALGRVDYKLNEKDSVFVRFAYDNNQSNNGQATATAVTTTYPNPVASNRYDNWLIKSATVGYTHIFSPGLVNSVGISLLRQDFPFLAGSYGGNWPARLGLPSSVPEDTLPIVSNGLPAFSGSAGFRAYTNPQVTDTLTKLIGTHSLTMGFDVRENIGTQIGRSNASGTFSFAANLTGNTYATFLTGAVSSATITLIGEEQDRSFDGAFFLQDDWKATPRLTVNAGLRYEFQQRPYDQHNYYSNFNPTLVNPVTGLLGTVQYAGVGGAGRNFVNEAYLDFAPRIGFAYSVPLRYPTVIRAGYGIYHPLEYNNNYVGVTAGYTATTTTYSPPGGNANVPAFQFQNGFPTAPTPPQGAALGPNAFLGGAQTYNLSRDPTPMSQQYELSIQQQVPANVVLDATYAANRGTHFVAGNYNANSLNPSNFGLGATALSSLVPNPYAGVVPGGLGAATITKYQSLLPFPYYTTVTVANPHTGSFDYNSLELSAQKQTSAFTLLFGYTMSKLLDDSIGSPLAYLSTATNLNSYQNVYNQSAEYSLDPTDVSQRATATALYNLPFGHGQRFHSGNHIIDNVIGGFQINTIGSFQTGFPLAFSLTAPSTPYTATRPNYVPGVNVSLPNPTKAEWFNTAAFTTAPNYTFGNVPRTLPHVRAPGSEIVDLSVFKTTPIHDNVTIQFRIEAFNVLNHVNLGPPNTAFTPSNATASATNTNGSFGAITTAAPARQVQLALKLNF